MHIPMCMSPYDSRTSSNFVPLPHSLYLVHRNPIWCTADLSRVTSAFLRAPGRTKATCLEGIAAEALNAVFRSGELEPTRGTHGQALFSRHGVVASKMSDEGAIADLVQCATCKLKVPRESFCTSSVVGSANIDGNAVCITTFLGPVACAGLVASGSAETAGFDVIRAETLVAKLSASKRKAKGRTASKTLLGRHGIVAVDVSRKSARSWYVEGTAKESVARWSAGGLVCRRRSGGGYGSPDRAGRLRLRLRLRLGLRLRIGLLAHALLVHAHLARISAVLIRIARARLRAASSVNPAAREVVTAIALIAKLCACKVESPTSALLDTFFVGHVVGAEAITVHDAGIDRIGRTSCIRPPQGGNISTETLSRANRNLVLCTVAVRGGIGRAWSNRIAPRKLLHVACNLFVECLRKETIVGILVTDIFENIAPFEIAAGIVASVDCLLENIDIPPVKEVAVHSVAGWVTSGKNKRPFTARPATIKFVDVKQDLVKNGNHSNGVAWRTFARIHPVGVSHVALVVRRIDVSAVPARGEKYLHAKAVLAILVGKMGSLLVGVARVQTGIRSGTLFKGSLVGAGKGIPSEHAEAFRKSVQLFIGAVSALKIVHQHTTDLLDWSKGAIRLLAAKFVSI